MKKSIGALFLLWTGVIIVAYYIVQKPGLLGALAGLADTLWTLLVAGILLFNSFGLGRRILHLFKFETQDIVEHFLLSLGIGLGSIGLLGLLFSVIQLANPKILSAFQIVLTLFFLLRNDLKRLHTEFNVLASNLNLSFSQYSLFSKITILLLFTFSFLLTLVPPFEAFDALLYHLALPAHILKSGGLQAVNNVPFWFPSLSENTYLWALGMGSERAAQIIHFAWTVLAILLLWHWATKVWNIEIGRKTLLLLSAIPSLPLLASWAYADMALVYYAIASLYSFIKYRTTKSITQLILMGWMAGFAMGTKYTSFAVPLTCGLLLLLHPPFRDSISSALRFSFVALAIASPWYIRNGIFMSNPFYPFVFGGRYWDSFLARWYADSGTGIGWNPLQIILLPFNATLGTHDVTYFDGRIGPLFLILSPLAIWIIVRRSRQNSVESWSLFTIGIFSLISFIAWTWGVINSAGLWQARLLFPALIPFAIPTALAWDSFKEFDYSKLRISFVVNVLIAAVIAFTTIDNGIFVVQRNPLAVAIGAQSRERYIERVNPSYAALMTLVDSLPADAHLYSLFEPRSYGLSRTTQPDPINYNFAHDVYLYKMPDAIIQSWKSEGYTYIIIYERGLNFMIDTASSKFTPAMQSTLETTLKQLKLVAQTPDRIYSIYQIP